MIEWMKLERKITAFIMLSAAWMNECTNETCYCDIWMNEKAKRHYSSSSMNGSSIQVSRIDERKKVV